MGKTLRLCFVAVVLALGGLSNVYAAPEPDWLAYPTVDKELMAYISSAVEALTPGQADELGDVAEEAEILNQDYWQALRDGTRDMLPKLKEAYLQNRLKIVRALAPYPQHNALFEKGIRSIEDDLLAISLAHGQLTKLLTDYDGLAPGKQAGFTLTCPAQAKTVKKLAATVKADVDTVYDVVVLMRSEYEVGLLVAFFAKSIANPAQPSMLMELAAGRAKKVLEKVRQEQIQFAAQLSAMKLWQSKQPCPKLPASN